MPAPVTNPYPHPISSWQAGGRGFPSGLFYFLVSLDLSDRSGLGLRCREEVLP